MRQRTAGFIVLGLVALGLVLYFFYPPLWLIDTGEYETTNVTVHDENGSELASVDVRIADTRDKRIVGLSKTDSLENDSGMLFVHGSEGSQSYVMRDMSFPLDIIFIDSESIITEIHNAAQDADGSFSGRAKYVLEVNRGWADQHGVEIGDEVRIADNVE